MAQRFLYGYCTTCMCCGQPHPVKEACGNAPMPNSTKNKRQFNLTSRCNDDGPLVGMLFVVFVLSVIFYFALSMNTVVHGADMTWEQEMAEHINMVCADDLHRRVTEDQLTFLGIGPEPNTGNMYMWFMTNIGPNCEDWRNRTKDNNQIWKRPLELFGD